jgi:hypothetical protein
MAPTIRLSDSPRAGEVSRKSPGGVGDAGALKSDIAGFRLARLLVRTASIRKQNVTAGWSRYCARPSTAKAWNLAY